MLRTSTSAQLWTGPEKYRMMRKKSQDLPDPAHLGVILKPSECSFIRMKPMVKSFLHNFWLMMQWFAACSSWWGHLQRHHCSHRISNNLLIRRLLNACVSCDVTIQICMQKIRQKVREKRRNSCTISTETWHSIQYVGCPINCLRVTSADIAKMFDTA